MLASLDERARNCTFELAGGGVKTSHLYNPLTKREGTHSGLRLGCDEELCSPHHFGIGFSDVPSQGKSSFLSAHLLDP